MGINYMVNMVDILYISDLFINLFSALKLRVNGLYIIIKDYIIWYMANNSIIGHTPLIGKDLFQLNIVYIILSTGNYMGYTASLIIQK